MKKRTSRRPRRSSPSTSGVPQTPYEAELMLGALLLVAERMDEHEQRVLLSRVRANAKAHKGAASDFMWAYADVLAERMD